MSARIRHHIRSNVIGYLALFVALSGTAYATHPGGANTISSGDIIDGQVRTADVGAGEVKEGDIGATAVNSSKIADGQVTEADVGQAAVASNEVKNDSLTGGDILDESLTGFDVGDNSLKGADVDEATLGQVPVAALGGKGRSFGVNGFACDPDGAAFADCGFVRLDIPAQNRAAGTRVLVTGAIEALVEGNADDGLGFCRLGFSPPDAPGNPLVETLTSYAVSNDDIGDIGEAGAMMAVTPPVGPGTLDFGIECREADGKIDFVSAKVAAVAISPN